jgi:hypothetical protein
MSFATSHWSGKCPLGTEAENPLYQPERGGRWFQLNIRYALMTLSKIIKGLQNKGVFPKVDSINKLTVNKRSLYTSPSTSEPVGL